MHRAIAWFARNSVAANLLMFILVLAGVLALFTVHQQTFPNIDPDVVMVNVPYLGAAPEEVEQGVCVRIEEAVEGTEGIKKVRSSATEGQCNVIIELTEDAIPIQALNEIKSKIDAINTFPRETEKPIVSKLAIRHGVMDLVLFGDVDERTLKEIGTRVRDEVSALPGVSQVSLSYVRPYEISIEVSETTLRRHGLTLERVADIIRRTSLDMPGGNIKTSGGEILLRTKGQAYTGREFEDIVVLTGSDGGAKVLLREIATVIDGFEEGDLAARYNGVPAVVVKVSRIGKEDIIGISDTVKAYVDRLVPTLPQAIQLDIWQDESKILRDRISSLLATGAGGLVLVMLILSMFLRFRLAMWVAAGIPIAMLGTVAMFPYFDIEISMLAIMAFILVLGIIVDDAIVVGERVYAHEIMGKPPIRAAIDGTWEVSTPVIFGVLTTMAAFLPLIISSGRMADVFGTIGWIVIISLVFSIIESQLILPAHLAHRNHETSHATIGRAWTRLQDSLSGAMGDFASQVYRPFLQKALAWRYLTTATGVAVLILVMGMIGSGRIVFSFFPPVEGDIVFATLEMPAGTSIETTTEAVKLIEAGAKQLRAELDAGLADGQPSRVKAILSSIGTHLDRGPGPPRLPQPGRSNYADVAMELIPANQRDMLASRDVGDRWREIVGAIPDAVKLSYSSDSFTAGNALDFQLAGRDIDQLREAAAEVRAELSRYDGVFDISDSFRAGKQEIKLSLLPEALNWGVALNDLARQTRAAFYGVEAQRIQRGQDDVRVMVRFPEDERRSIGNLEDMRIRTADGTEVPFTSVATFELGRGFSTINRLDGRRVINVTADIDRTIARPESVIASMLNESIPEILRHYPDISIGLAGEQEERATAMASLALGAVLALVIIYTLLAVPLRSYIQPLVIMSVIPFGAVGAILGHYIMDTGLMFFSLLGIIALSGVVVNASLVLVDYINRRRREGVELVEAVATAGVVRFRPIILTSVTTFIGLLPMLSRGGDPTTAFIIPMAISLAFGVLFATVITLILVPCLYLIVEDYITWGELDREARLADQDAAYDTAQASMQPAMGGGGN
ncbi:MAG: efflux RND transporter permease subunit [Gammaproteobacteria bacterium]|nr:MAG: efflux RND transporter permease subunit [Gammaproteobacteria bacterium]